MRNDAVGEGRLVSEDEIRRLRCRFVGALRPHLLHLGGAEFDSIWVAEFVKAVGREQNAVSWAELHDVPSVGGAWEQSWGQATLA